VLALSTAIQMQQLLGMMQLHRMKTQFAQLQNLSVCCFIKEQANSLYFKSILAPLINFSIVDQKKGEKINMKGSRQQQICMKNFSSYQGSIYTWIIVPY